MKLVVERFARVRLQGPLNDGPGLIVTARSFRLRAAPLPSRCGVGASPVRTAGRRSCPTSVPIGQPVDSYPHGHRRHSRSGR